VCKAISAVLHALVLSDPGQTMLGFRQVPSSITLLSSSALKSLKGGEGKMQRGKDEGITKRHRIQFSPNFQKMGKRQACRLNRSRESNAYLYTAERTSSVTRAQCSMVCGPSMRISGSTMGTRPSDWQMAAYLRSSAISPSVSARSRSLRGQSNADS